MTDGPNMYESDENTLPFIPMFQTPPPKQVLAPTRTKKRKVSRSKFESAKKVFWWQPTPQDVNREILLQKLQGFDCDTLGVIFSFTDFWTLLASESCGIEHIEKIASKEIKSRLKF